MKISDLPVINPQLALFIPKDKWTERWNHSYTYEPKYDGYCALLYWTRESGAHFISREHNEHPHVYSFVKKTIHEALSQTNLDALILHGELYAFDGEHPTGNLEALQNRNNTRCNLRYVAFDYIWDNHSDLRTLSLRQRRKALAQLVKRIQVKYVKLMPSKSSIEQLPSYSNLEGYVVKDLDAPYYEKRHPSWVKLKERQGSDFIVVGYTEGLGQYSDLFGSLELAEFQGDKLVRVGNVGTGFTVAQREIVYKWIQDHCVDKWTPFIVEVVYPRRTSAGILWHPSFIKARFPGE